MIGLDGLDVYIVQLPLTQRENIIAVFLCVGARQRPDSVLGGFASPAFGSDVSVGTTSSMLADPVPTTCRTQLE